MNVFKEIYNYRELLKTNIKKEIRGKYKGSWLGVLWTFLNPLLMLAVYAFVFPYILRVNVDNYTIFMIVALIPWNFFTTAIQSGTGSVVANGNILKKVYFPREILPISIVTSGLINFLISCVIILIFVLLGGCGISWHLIFLPFIALIQYIISLAIIFLLSAFNVYVKDVEYMVTFIINLFFYATPVLYSTEMFQGSWMIWLFRLNPMAHLINAYRDIFYVHRVPALGNLGILLIIGIVALTLCYKAFKKLEKRFAEEV